ncbi:uncharacterized protein VP01_5104g1 [Puccinia sorghi]|uniref:Retrotransposon gag domain-containing protein n=1 Tax=Puccinia sorghi TaxID=27349 RepID=A0A0L6UL78_9BASI|nr:uncharacterized protein VP01_5104g1 [Puccinia sorghi]
MSGGLIGQQNQEPTPPQIVPAPPPTSSPNSVVLAKPQPFEGTCCAAAKSFVGQILLHAVTYPDQFPTNSRKVAFSVSFMTDYAATWSQLYLMRVFNAEEVVFEKFLDDFGGPTIPLPNQKSVALYAGVQLTCSHFWMGQHPTDESLPAWTEKENVQLAVVMSNIEFTSLRTMQAMALKAGQRLEGIQNFQPAVERKTVSVGN